MTSEPTVTSPDSPRSSRDLVQRIALARAAIGLALLVAPRPAGRLFVGGLVDQPAGLFVSRAVGARDLALALGLLVAMQRDRPLRGWVEAAVLVDALDAAAATFAGRGLPVVGRLLLAAGGAAWAIAGVASAPHVDTPNGSAA